MSDTATNRKRAAVVRQTSILLLDLQKDVAPPTSSAPAEAVPVGERLSRLAIHPQASWIAGVSTREKLIHIFNPEGRSTSHFPVCVRRGEHFAFSPDGQWFGVCANSRFELYPVNDWKKCAFWVPRSSGGDQAAPLAFTSDSKILAVADSRYRIRLYSLPGRVATPLATDGRERRRVPTLFKPLRDQQWPEAPPQHLRQHQAGSGVTHAENRARGHIARIMRADIDARESHRERQRKHHVNRAAIEDVRHQHSRKPCRGVR